SDPEGPTHRSAPTCSRLEHSQDRGYPPRGPTLGRPLRVHAWNIRGIDATSDGRVGKGRHDTWVGLHNGLALIPCAAPSTDRRATLYAMTPYRPTAASSIAVSPTPLTSQAPARTGNSVVSTSPSIVWFSTKMRFGSSASSSRRMSPSSVAASPRVRATIDA